jgi:protein SCO1/2
MKAPLLAAALAISVLSAAPAPMAQSVFTAQQLAALSFQQHPGTPLPLDAPLRDEDSRPVRLGDFFGTRPVVLVLEYLKCRTLCGFVLADLADALANVPLRAGYDFAVIAISIDPGETAADARLARDRYLARYRQAAGWHFLTGEDSAVRRIADAVGFPYRYDGEGEQFAHPAGVVIVAPGGRIARYILGIDYRPIDLRLAIVEAGQGAIAAPVSDLLLLCYGYDAASGRYSTSIHNALRLIAGLSVAAVAAMLVILSRQRGG